jgi:hypothetical protein
VAAVLGALGARLSALRPRLRGVGGGPPSADQGGGAADLEATQERYGATARPAPAVTPSLVADADPVPPDVEGSDEADVELLGRSENPYRGQGAPHVTQPPQPTLGQTDVPPEAA